MVALGGYLIVLAVHLVMTPREILDWASEALAAAIIAAAFVILQRGGPRTAARLTVFAVWAELHFTFLLDAQLYGAGLPALPSLVVGAGLLAGGHDAMLVAAVSAVSVPAAVTLGRALQGLSLVPPQRELFAMCVLAVVLLATALLLHLALRSFAEVVAGAQGSARRLSDIVKAVPDGIVALDAAGRVESVNPAAERVLGADATAVAGQPLVDVLRAMTAPAEGAPRALEDLPGTRELRRGDGTTADAEITTHPTADAAGVLGTLVMMRDVTERRRAAERQEELQRQLLHAQKLEAVGQFAGGVAHDFNNLLHALSGNLELARAALEEGTAATPYLDEIGAASTRAASLVQQLLAYTRRQVSAPRTVDLAVVVSGIESLLRRLLPEDIAIEIDAPAGLGPVRVDPGQFEQVLVNLAVNARDAMPGGGQLRIALARRDLDELAAAMVADLAEGPHLELTVSDTGCGMTPEVLAHVFEPFFTTKREGKGSGLGLATVYGIVKQAEGHVGVESRPGEGTTIRILLRCAAGPVEAPARAPAAGGEAPRGTERLLVVDDHSQVRGVTVRILRSLGYEVLEAEDGRQALALAEATAEPIDLLITDVVMPNIGGRELADLLRARQPGLPVLFTSGYAEDAIAHRGVVGDGVHLIAKPFAPRELAQRVRLLLGAEAAT